VAIALLIQASIGPSSRSIRSAAASTAWSSATSQAIASTGAPNARRSASVLRSRVSPRASTATDQPACAKATAVALPIPMVPPVMTTTLAGRALS
jgi:hypothetical protein